MRIRVCARPKRCSRNTGTPPDLWKYGISGDLPIVLVTIGDAAHLGLAQELVRAQEYLRARGFKFDLVVLNEIPTSYRQDVQDDLQRMAEASPSHAWLDRPGGLFLRRADLMSEGDRVLLRAVARAIFEGARGGLDVQIAAAAAAVGAAAENQNEAGWCPSRADPRPRDRAAGVLQRIRRVRRRTAASFTSPRGRPRHGRTSSRTSASGSSRRIRGSAPRGRRTAITTG